MRSVIKNNFPYLYNTLAKIYAVTPQGKIRKAEWRKQKKELNNYILNNYFNCSADVKNGPFMGMKYLAESSGSAFLPKIIGSYEEPIHDWVELIIQRNYKTIVDIGCAEGYYAVGFARRMPQSKIVAFDTNRTARKLCKDLAMINEIENIEINDYCSHEILNELCTNNTLIFCDIEGFEKKLLNPAKAKNLLKADIVVELHDFIKKGTTNAIIKRFCDTHRIQINLNYTARNDTYACISRLSADEYQFAINEYRSKYAKFMFCSRLENC